jgi:hypothetical protein
MKTFHIGGRFGDLIYSLWTMRELGGGRLIVSDYHQGNWSLEHARTMEGFLRYQPYITDVDFMPWDEATKHADVDLQLAERDYNPELFPECDFTNGWPGPANIAKRYALGSGLVYRPGEIWLNAIHTEDFDVVIHAPMRRAVRPPQEWHGIISGVMPGTKGCLIDSIAKGDWMGAASEIAYAKVFLGCVSGPHALAEGLGTLRVVEQAPDCFNVGAPLHCINGWPVGKVVSTVREICKV